MKVIRSCIFFLDLSNLALGKNTVQISTYGHQSWGWFGYSKYAVDGIKETNHQKAKCTHTNNENFPWWRVDLGGLARVYSVSITNRGDCCEDRLQNFDIRVGESLKNNGNDNTLCEHVTAIPAGETKEYICPYPLKGRYVNVQMLRREVLTLCEVEVYGSFNVF